MNKDGKYSVLAFVSTHWAVKAETILESEDYPGVIVIPTPREISAGCGISLRIPENIADRACAAIEEEGVGKDRYQRYRY